MCENKKKETIGKVYAVIKIKEGEQYVEGQEVDMLFQSGNVFDVDDTSSNKSIKKKAMDFVKEFECYEDYIVLNIGVYEINRVAKNTRVRGCICNVLAIKK